VQEAIDVVTTIIGDVPIEQPWTSKKQVACIHADNNIAPHHLQLVLCPYEECDKSLLKQRDFSSFVQPHLSVWFWVLLRD
jgi:hypothetical protein